MHIKGSHMGQRLAGRAALATLAACALVLPAGAVLAEPIKNEMAVFAALDKVTGRIQHLEIPIDQTVEFGALRVTPRICNSRPLGEMVSPSRGTSRRSSGTGTKAPHSASKFSPQTSLVLSTSREGETRCLAPRG